MFRISLALCLLALLVMASVAELPWFDRRWAVSAGGGESTTPARRGGTLVVELPASLALPRRGEVRLSLAPRDPEVVGEAPRVHSTTLSDGLPEAESGIRIEAGGRRLAVDGLAAGDYLLSLELVDGDARSADALRWWESLTVDEGSDSLVRLD